MRTLSSPQNFSIILSTYPGSLQRIGLSSYFYQYPIELSTNLLGRAWEGPRTQNAQRRHREGLGKACRRLGKARDGPWKPEIVRETPRRPRESPRRPLGPSQGTVKCCKGSLTALIPSSILLLVMLDLNLHFYFFLYDFILLQYVFPICKPNELWKGWMNAFGIMSK